MRKLKLFLACSSELKADRQRFEIFIARRNKAWFDKGIFIELLIWEDFSDSMSQTRLQDKYNQAIRGCDLFVMLFSTKVGLFTEEEFTTAFGNFKATNKPLVYTYFKDTGTNTSSAKQDDQTSLLKFQEKLKMLGHFQTVYKNNEDLLLKFSQQFDKLIDSDFFPVDANHLNKQTFPAVNNSTNYVIIISGLVSIIALAGIGAWIWSNKPSNTVTNRVVKQQIVNENSAKPEENDKIHQVINGDNGTSVGVNRRVINIGASSKKNQ